MVVRRSRTRPVPVARIVRRPRTEGRSVRVVLEVMAEIVDGQITPDDLRAWVEDAVERYHLWRNGWVGIGCVGHIKRPEVAECPDEK